MGLHLAQLRLIAPARGIGLRLALEQLDLLPQHRKGTQFPSQLIELSPSRAQLYRFLLEVRGSLCDGSGLVVSHTNLGLESHCGFPQLLQLLPAWPNLSEALLSCLTRQHCSGF